MKIKMVRLKVEDLSNGYIDNAESGVKAFHGLLDVRPAFQREFIYKEAQRDEVMRTVFKGFPLNTMYWSVCANPSGVDVNSVNTAEDLLKSGMKFELMDGQQRTISICQYLDGAYSVNFDKSSSNVFTFNNLTKDEQDRIKDYEVFVYICDGTASEKLEWFKVINIGGVVLTPQELRNAIYTGPWLSDAKKFFSKRNCTAFKIAHSYLSGEMLRQDYLQTALSWIANRDGISIEDYMSDHQNDANAEELITYFKSVVDWIEVVFPSEKGVRNDLMKGLKWGVWYNAYAKTINTSQAERVKRLLNLDNDEIVRFSGIYEYILTGKESALSIRTFGKNDKLKAYNRQKGICPLCGKHFEFDQMHGDHIVPWSKGGRTEFNNLQMLCAECNIKKSNYDAGFTPWDGKKYTTYSLNKQ